MRKAPLGRHQSHDEAALGRSLPRLYAASSPLFAEWIPNHSPIHDQRKRTRVVSHCTCHDRWYERNVSSVSNHSRRRDSLEFGHVRPDDVEVESGCRPLGSG